MCQYVDFKAAIEICQICFAYGDLFTQKAKVDKIIFQGSTIAGRQRDLN